MGCAKKRINPTVANHVNRNFTTYFTRSVIKAVHQLPPPWKPKRRGRKGHDPRKVAVCCILKVGFNQTYDSIEATINDSITLNSRYESLPKHSVIHRRMKQIPMRYIRKVMNRVILFLRRKNMNIAVDSTGFSTQNSSTWYEIRIERQGKRKNCLKLHISADIDTGVIHWFTITPWNRHDSKEFKHLIKHLPDLGNVLGDKAFSSRNNCQLVVDKNGTPYLCFRKNVRSNAKGKPAWILSFRAYKHDSETWLAVYHLRSIIESVFSSIKKRWGSFLLSRKRWMQKKELALKVFSYNVKQVLMIRYAKERKVPLWIHI
jgi:hypothetical protein